RTKHAGELLSGVDWHSKGPSARYRAFCGSSGRKGADMPERKLEVLRAIVEDYVATREPVGSKMLVDRHRLGVSSATIRNDMSTLEDEGLIAQPHTSAGRVPTDKGYRTFV